MGTIDLENIMNSSTLQKIQGTTDKVNGLRLHHLSAGSNFYIRIGFIKRPELIKEIGTSAPVSFCFFVSCCH